jgi:uncharacterized membrane protein YhaH (DUF805 family)
MRRRDFWIFIIASWGIFMPCFIYFLTKPSKSDNASPFVMMIISLCVLIIFTISASVRRLHDVGKSGCYAWLLLFMPFTFILLYFFLLDSQKKVNRWGASPKYPYTNDTDPYKPYEEPQEYQQPIVNNPNIIYIKETKVIYVDPNSQNPYPYYPPQPNTNQLPNDVYVTKVSETYEPEN